VRVVVVPAPRGELSEVLGSEIRGFLLSHAIPGVDVEVAGPNLEELSLAVALYIDSARFNPEDVKDSVAKLLYQRFALEERAIGAPVYLSAIYQCVESVTGVDHSICKFVKEKEDETPDEHVWWPSDHDCGVLYLSDVEDSITLTNGEAQQ